MRSPRLLRSFRAGDDSRHGLRRVRRSPCFAATRRALRALRRGWPAAALGTWLLGAAAALGSASATAGETTVFAAASLKNAMDEIRQQWAEATPHTASVALAGSSELARQIQLGAPADVFISANVDWMDALEADGLLAPGTRFDLVGNALVLIAHGRDGEPIEIAPGFDLAGRLGDGHLAMALVDAVPAGIYGKAALERLGVWSQVRSRVAQADNVRAALAFVSTGEAPLGIVYASDAVADPRVTVIGRFPADLHPAIRYPAAAIAASRNPENRAFLEFLRGDAARAAFRRQGFRVLE